MTENGAICDHEISSRLATNCNSVFKIKPEKQEGWQEPQFLVGGKVEAKVPTKYQKMSFRRRLKLWFFEILRRMIFLTHLIN